MATFAPCVVDTNCISLGLDENNDLAADLIVAPSGGLECSASGAAVKLDPAPCNGLSVGANGLYGPPIANSRLYTGGVSAANPANVPYVGNRSDGLGLDADLQGIWANRYNPGLGYATMDLTPVGTLSITNTSCYIWNLEAGWSMGPVEIQARNGWRVNVGQANTISSPHMTGSAGPGVTLNLSQSPLAAGNPIGLRYPATDYYVQTWLNPGESATITIKLVIEVIKQGAFHPANCYSVGTCNLVSVFFGGTLRLYAWSREPV